MQTKKTFKRFLLSFSDRGVQAEPRLVWACFIVVWRCIQCFLLLKLWFWVYFYKESENEIWFIFTSVNMLGTKKKKDEQTPAERNKKKRSWFNFPQDFLGLGCKWLCYQKLCKRGKSKRQWQSQQWFELRIWPSGNVDLESTYGVLQISYVNSGFW